MNNKHDREMTQLYDIEDQNKKNTDNDFGM